MANGNSFLITYSCCLQEILDQIADIDLVLNLKCAEESVMKKTLGSGIYSPPPAREFHSLTTSGFNLSLQQKAGVPFPSSKADSETIWKEKLHMYAEQVSSINIVSGNYMSLVQVSCFGSNMHG